MFSHRNKKWIEYDMELQYYPEYIPPLVFYLEVNEAVKILQNKSKCRGVSN